MSHMRISWCFSFLNMAGGSAGTLICCPKALAMTRENRLNCSSFSASEASSSGWGARLTSRLPFLLSSGFCPDPSPSSSGSPPPPPPGAAVAPCHGDGGGLPPPAPEASGVSCDTLPFPLTCSIKVCTIAFSSEISPSRACSASWCSNISCFMRLRLIS